MPWLNVPSGAQWLDVGCGTGTLVHTILDTVYPQAVLGIDSSEGYIEFVCKEVQDPRGAFDWKMHKDSRLSQVHMMQLFLD